MGVGSVYYTGAGALLECVREVLAGKPWRRTKYDHQPDRSFL